MQDAWHSLYCQVLWDSIAEGRVIHVLEFCVENLMNHIFQNPENILRFSGITFATKNVLGWAKDVVTAKEFIHNQGIVHRNFKLEKILVCLK